MKTRPETADATTIVIEPNAPWPGHLPGQYLRIGAEIDGVRHWRAYSITSDPDHPRNLVSITVKCVHEGKLSPFFSREIGQDSMVYLGEVEGTFGLPDPLPEKLLFVSAGSGITPIMSMIRELDRQSALNDVVHVHCGPRRRGLHLRRHAAGDRRPQPGLRPPRAPERRRSAASSRRASTRRAARTGATATRSRRARASCST